MRLHRRDLFRASASGLLSAMAYRALERAAFAGDMPAAPSAGTAKAKSVIVLWMNGGPSHVDTWDPKPGSKVQGPHKAIATRTKGLLVSEHLPRLAQLSDKYAVVRGTSKEGNHQRAQYFLRTGYAPNPTVVHPSLGGWVSRKLGAPKNGLPGFVSVGGPSLGAGFLGVQHGPFVLGKGGDLPSNTGYGPSVERARFMARKALLEQTEADFARFTGDPKVQGHAQVYDKAEQLMHSADLPAFDISKEPEKVRAAFGDTDFGRGCLGALRLVERGVPFVEVSLDGWDTHVDNFTKTKNLMGTLDPAMSALITELERRGKLSNTIVLWMGDFGRTPKINGNDGRDHHPGAWSAVLAGGGITKGVVHGETDADAEKVVKDAVTAPNLLATVATALGLDPAESFLTPIGRPISITDHGAPIPALLRG
jgi:uncharacterized protein (DUF1501 family)